MMPRFITGLKGEQMMDYEVDYKGAMMSIHQAAKLIRQNDTECTFCHEKGHKVKECPVRKAATCRECGGQGHTAAKCNKIKTKVIDGTTKVGMCTWKECKGVAKWGHWMGNCPKALAAAARV